MEIETKWATKVFFPHATFVQIYFEAVANAFDANANNVTIAITSDGTINNSKSFQIVIKDDGDGFTNERFDQFRRLSEPKDSYHKGLGRLVYLHYFSLVQVVSVFDKTKRIFAFDSTFKGDHKDQAALETDERGTELRFSGFVNQRLRSYDDLKPSILKEKLLEQFLPFFHSRKKENKVFNIQIQLDTEEAVIEKELFTDRQSVTISDVPELECKSIAAPILGLFEKIEMYFRIQEVAGPKAQQLIAACIDGRTIPIKLLSQNAIPENYAAIFLFESPMFIGRSDSARQRLHLPDAISLETFHDLLRRELALILKAKLPEIEDRNTRIKQQFEDRYPHLTGLFQEDTVGIINKEEALEVAQKNFFKKQRKILECESPDEEIFRMSLEVSSRTLTEYILYREIIINQLSKVNTKDTEDVAHNLIVPRFSNFQGDNLLEGIYSNNAWLLDDKFMSFRTILSEKRMDQVIKAITGSDTDSDDTRPDISMVFSADPDREKVDVVIVELKRRTENDKDNTYVYTQLATRAQKLADYCPNIQRMWYYGVIDINPELSRTLRTMRWTPLFSRGSVFYFEFNAERKDGTSVPAPTCLLDFNALIKDAAARNHTFLEILKSGFKRAKGKD